VYEVSGGWALGDRDDYREEQDEMHSSAIYSRLENEIVPLFYEAREDGVPHEWVKRVKQSLKNLNPAFDMSRMLKDYGRLLYDPAHEAFTAAAKNKFEAPRARVRWNQLVRSSWDHVRFLEMEGGPATPVYNGRTLPLRAAVDLAGLSANDVRVEAVVGRVGPSGNLEQVEIYQLPPVDQHGTVYVFSTEFMPHQTGRLGYSLRISSNNFTNPLMRPCEALLKWG
jgi:glycogen phosphorylase